MDIHAFRIIKSLLGLACSVKWLRNFFCNFSSEPLDSLEKFYFRDEEDTKRKKSFKVKVNFVAGSLYVLLFLNMTQQSRS